MQTNPNQSQIPLFNSETDELFLNIQEASTWATKFTGKDVTAANISYLVQYGLIRKYTSENGTIQILQNELKDYYESRLYKRQENWKKRLGDDINWHLSFENVKESETTKHVHRLHPYKGKFIPQLVEYFLDAHTDEFKKDIFFRPGDIVLDPFCGSGTTLVQANELGIHGVGIDISLFNALISNIKVSDVNLPELEFQIRKINKLLEFYVNETKILDFDNALLIELRDFNSEFFPSPEFKYKAKRGEINSDAFGAEYEKNFLGKYYDLINKYQIKISNGTESSFLDKWYIKPIKNEVFLVNNEIEKIQDVHTKNILKIILSRTIRSCRATTHSDLATLKEPIVTTYYCPKHGKICKPIFTILKKWLLYSKDTIKRLSDYKKLKTNSYQYCITGDSRTVDIINCLIPNSTNLANLVENKKINGIFSSPPYVGLIDYHEQHAYAYELFDLPRNDESEIGPLYKGGGKAAQSSYVEGIASVLNNSKRFLHEGYNIFLVANDKNNLYPEIAKIAGMKIVNEYKRPVLNRSERDKNAFAETIFHMKEK